MPRQRLRHQGPCDHPTVVAAFAWLYLLNCHWPIRYCDECLKILSGRSPWLTAASTPEAELIAAKWSREWPKHGKPRTFRPRADLIWPEAA